MRVLAINVEIGLGHPNYLDYVLQAIREREPKTEIIIWDILKQEKGLSRLFWQTASHVYQIGSQGGVLTKVYNQLRQGKKTVPIQLCRLPDGKFDRIITSHPLLANYLKRVSYIHGEIAMPKECTLENVEKIIVPIEYTKNKLLKQETMPGKINISGLLIASELARCAHEHFEKRITRIKSDKPLTIGFFISGAYPTPHIKKIQNSLTALSDEQHRLIVFLGVKTKKANDFLRQLNRNLKDKNQQKSSILFITGKTRNDYQIRVNRLLPLLDIMVAPSHEHTNWAVGLGLPMFALFPMIGSYAQENYDFAQKQQMVYPIRTTDSAKNFGNIVDKLRQSGELLKMAENGFNKFPIDGVDNTARIILENENKQQN